MGQGVERRSARASDSERASAERALQRHFTAGRLDVTELERRLDIVHAATRRAELRAALTELPRPARPPRRLRAAHRASLTAHASGYVAFNGGAVALWAAEGGGTFWPVVTLVPGAALLAWHAFGVPAIGRAMVRPRARRGR